MLRRLNDALPGLVAGEVLYGLLVQLIGMWFVEDKWYFSIGLWYGVAMAIGMSVHLSVVIYDAVTLYDPDRAKKGAIVKSVTRYGIIVLLFFMIGFFNFGNFIMTFVGVLSIKISAYAQPLLAKLMEKLSGGRIKAWVGDDEALLEEYLASQQQEENS